jgi:mono/diheme cytochrome c family protein
LTCVKAARVRRVYYAAMSTTPPFATPTAPRRMPLTVRLALGQLVLAVIAFGAVPVLALKKTFAPEPALVANVSADAEESADAAAGDDAGSALASADPLARGEALYAQSCAACHQPGGTGIPGAFPPLAGSDYLLADPERAAGVVLHGLFGPVTVNGVTYESAMPPVPLEDADVAAVLTYVLQAWGNQGPAVTPETVARVRAAGPAS